MGCAMAAAVARYFTSGKKETIRSDNRFRVSIRLIVFSISMIFGDYGDMLHGTYFLWDAKVVGLLLYGFSTPHACTLITGGSKAIQTAYGYFRIYNIINDLCRHQFSY